MNIRDKIYGFLVFCSSADRDILDRDGCATERTKYAGIGATVFLTGVFAFMSGSYALSRVFVGSEHGVYFALGIGVVWGVTIFNLDRLMVGGIRKSDSVFRQFVAAVPRLIMAVFISLVVAKPLEVRLFSDQIAMEIERGRLDEVANGAAKAEETNRTGRLSVREENLERRLEATRERRGEEPDTEVYRQLSGELASAQASLRAQQSRWSQSAPRTAARRSASARIGELRPQVARLSREVAAERSRYQQEVEAGIRSGTEALAATSQSRIRAERAAEESSARTEAVANRAYNESFIMQVTALGRLTGERYTTPWWTGIMITLLFLVVETAPIFVKLLSKRGPYDEMLEVAEGVTRELKADSAEALKSLTDERNRLVAKYELDLQKKILERTAAVQLEVATKQLDDWRVAQLAKPSPHVAPAPSRPAASSPAPQFASRVQNGPLPRPSSGDGHTGVVGGAQPLGTHAAASGAAGRQSTSNDPVSGPIGLTGDGVVPPFYTPQGTVSDDADLTAPEA